MRHRDEGLDVPDAALGRRWRPAACVALPACASASMDIALVAHDVAASKPLDPIYDVTLLPLAAWLVGAAEQPSRRGMMAMALS